MKKLFPLLTLILLPLTASAAIFQSQPVGIQVGDGSTAATQAGDNLIYGVLGPSSTGSLLLLQNGSGSDRLRVDYAGNVTVAGTLTVSGQSVCLADGSNCPAGTASTLQTVTDAGNTTTQAITVATINTGPGATEVYLMNQNVRTTDSPTFAALSVTTLNTGLGAYELYAMNQNVQTSDSPTFSALTLQGASITSTQTASAHFYANSYRGYQIRLDSDNNSTETFQINNGANSTVLTVDESGNMTTTGQLTVAGRILGVSTPSADTDAANKAYVDTQVAAAATASYITTTRATSGETNCSYLSSYCPSGWTVVTSWTYCVYVTDTLKTAGYTETLCTK